MTIEEFRELEAGDIVMLHDNRLARFVRFALQPARYNDRKGYFIFFNSDEEVYTSSEEVEKVISKASDRVIDLRRTQ